MRLILILALVLFIGCSKEELPIEDQCRQNFLDIIGRWSVTTEKVILDVNSDTLDYVTAEFNILLNATNKGIRYHPIAEVEISWAYQCDPEYLLYTERLLSSDPNIEWYTQTEFHFRERNEDYMELHFDETKIIDEVVTTERRVWKLNSLF